MKGAGSGPAGRSQTDKKNRPENPGRSVYKKRTCRLFLYESFHYGDAGRDEADEIETLL